MCGEYKLSSVTLFFSSGSPHIRGEYSIQVATLSSFSGSPPHTWRIPERAILRSCSLRITSTYVENTYRWFFWWCCQQDHLHIRGEYGLLRFRRHYVRGSPPHTWRILSAADSSALLKRDHLHIRGEYTSEIDLIFVLLGSPPHTWRILCIVISMDIHMRITSTYVENTYDVLTAEDNLQDHLHIRGEYPISSIDSPPIKGSPPHTWRIQKSTKKRLN